MTRSINIIQQPDCYRTYNKKTHIERAGPMGTIRIPAIVGPPRRRMTPTQVITVLQRRPTTLTPAPTQVRRRRTTPTPAATATQPEDTTPIPATRLTPHRVTTPTPAPMPAHRRNTTATPARPRISRRRTTLTRAVKERANLGITRTPTPPSTPRNSIIPTPATRHITIATGAVECRCDDSEVEISSFSLLSPRQLF